MISIITIDAKDVTQQQQIVMSLHVYLTKTIDAHIIPQTLPMEKKSYDNLTCGEL